MTVELVVSEELPPSVMGLYWDPSTDAIFALHCDISPDPGWMPVTPAFVKALMDKSRVH